MNLDELIKILIEFQDRGYGNLKVADFGFMPIENVRKGINVDYNTGNEEDIIIIE